MLSRSENVSPAELLASLPPEQLAAFLKQTSDDERARVTAAIFWMKTRGGWSETSTHKHTGVANGDPIEVEVGTVRERLMRRIARIAAATTTRGVPETDE